MREGSEAKNKRVVRMLDNMNCKVGNSEYERFQKANDAIVMMEEGCELNNERRMKDRSMESNRSTSTMRGWPASHFATITAVAGKQQARPGNLTANRLN